MALPQAVLFDKDGTLIDLHLTWGVALGSAIEASAIDADHQALAFQAMHYDPAARRFAMTSPFVAEPIDVIDDSFENISK